MATCIKSIGYLVIIASIAAFHLSWAATDSTLAAPPSTSAIQAAQPYILQSGNISSPSVNPTNSANPTSNTSARQSFLTTKRCAANFKPQVTMKIGAPNTRGIDYNYADKTEVNIVTSSGICVQRIFDAGNGYRVEYLVAQLYLPISYTNKTTSIGELTANANVSNITYTVECHPTSSPMTNFYDRVNSNCNTSLPPWSGNRAICSPLPYCIYGCPNGDKACFVCKNDNSYGCITTCNSFGVTSHYCYCWVTIKDGPLQRQYCAVQCNPTNRAGQPPCPTLPFP